MTVVEVLVASIVSAVVATGAAGAMGIGGRVVEQSVEHTADTTALARVLIRWPVEIAGSAGQRRDPTGTWWLCGTAACTGSQVAITPPAPGWALTRVVTTTHTTGTEVGLHWQLPDTTTLVVTGWRGPP